MNPRPSVRDAQGNVQRGEAVERPISLPLVPGRVEQCRLDNAFSLAIDVSGESWLLRIEAPFVVAWPEGTSARFNSEEGAWTSAVDVLLHNTVTHGSVTAEGVLRLTFADGNRLVVEPSEQWEAWQLEGPREQLIVCGPAGQLSRWPSQS